MTNWRASRWKLCTADVDMCVFVPVCLRFSSSSTTTAIATQQQTSRWWSYFFVFVCLFVSFHRCCFFINLQSVRKFNGALIGLDWIESVFGFDFVFLIQFLVFHFLRFGFVYSFCSVPFCKFTEFSFARTHTRTYYLLIDPSND